MCAISTLGMKRTGGLWDSRYRTSLVDTDGYLTACYRYIEMNPVRAGIVEKPEDYPWSSHRHHAFNEIDRIVTTHSFYMDMAETGLIAGKAIVPCLMSS